MNSDNKEIINAISELKQEVAVLKEKNESLSSYIFKELKVDIERLVQKVERCMDTSAENYHRNLRWAIATMITFIVGAFGWISFLISVK